jgi:hypothetical protein
MGWSVAFARSPACLPEACGGGILWNYTPSGIDLGNTVFHLVG